MLPPKRWLPGLRPFPIIPNTPLPPSNPKRQVIPTDWGHFLYPSDTAPPEHWKVGETVTIRMSTKLSTYTVGLWQNATLICILTVHSASAGSATEQTKTTSFDWIVTRSEPNVSAAVVGGLKEPLYRLQATHGSIPENQSRDWASGFESVLFGIGEAGGGNSTTPTKESGTSRVNLTTGLPTTTSILRTETITHTAGVPPVPTSIPPSPPLTITETPLSSKAGAIGGSVAGGLVVAVVIGALLWFLRRKRREQPQRGIKPHDISGPVQGSAQGTTLFQGDYLGESYDHGRGLSRLQLDLKPAVFEADGTPEMIQGEMWGKAWPRGSAGGVGESGLWMRVDCGLRLGSIGGEGRLNWGRLDRYVGCVGGSCDFWVSLALVLGLFKF